uniref:(northern house mosquito) hypothetical protein n=1 Tax=Culex pipiens TaxID=7175 RepID=A0A8D8CPE4_CULPI
MDQEANYFQIFNDKQTNSLVTTGKGQRKCTYSVLKSVLIFSVVLSTSWCSSSSAAAAISSRKKTQFTSCNYLIQCVSLHFMQSVMHVKVGHRAQQKQRRCTKKKRCY